MEYKNGICKTNVLKFVKDCLLTMGLGLGEQLALALVGSYLTFAYLPILWAVGGFATIVVGYVW